MTWGLSMSKAIYLLVERQVTANQKTAKDPSAYVNEYIKEEDVFAANTKPVIKHTVKMKINTKRFTAKQWEVDKELPCPTYNTWISAKNISRHAKQHNTTIQAIFPNEEDIKKASTEQNF